MTDMTKDTDPLELLIGKMLLDIIGPKTDQMATSTDIPKIQVFSFGDPVLAEALEKMLNATEGDLTYGEGLIGYDSSEKYNPTVKEILQNFANAIDILHNCKGTTPAAIRATETAIGHIQTACFWAQNALSGSKL